MRHLRLKIFFFILPFVNFNLIAQVVDSKKDSITYYLPKVVVTANRYEKNIFETHIPVSIVHKHEIWQHGIDNLGNLLQKQAGVNFTSVGPWSQKFVIRGLVGPQVLTLIDGMRLDVLRSYGNHAPLLDVEQIERVEIIRGPTSILYGSDAIGGVVNFITKKPGSIDKEFGLKGNLGLQYSSVDHQNHQSLTLIGNLHNWQFLLGLNNRNADDVNTPKGKLANTGFNGYSIDAKIYTEFSNKHYINITGQSNQLKDVGIPINKYAKNARFLKYNRDLVTLNYEYRSPKNIWAKSKINLCYQQGERNFDALIYQMPMGVLFVNQILNAHRYVDSFSGNFQNSFTFFKKNFLTTGIDVFANFDNTKRLADPEIYNKQGIIVKNPPADYTPPTPKSNRKGIAIFIEDEFAPWPKLTFTFGTRIDYIISHANATVGTLVEENRKETDSDFSGNIGILYRLSEKVRFIANIGRAFKAPTLQERYFKGVAQVGYLYGNPQLNSERSLNLDGGIKWKTGISTGEFNLFRNQIDNLIVMKPISIAADTFVYDNVGQAQIFGGEFQTEIYLTKRISVFLNSSYVYGQDVKSEEALPKIPPLEALLGLRYGDKNSNYWFEVNSRFVNEQNRVAKNEIETSGYNIFNFSTGVNLNRFLRLRNPLFLTFNIKNIFDMSYRDHLSSVTWWDAPGRNIIIGLRSNF